MHTISMMITFLSVFAFVSSCLAADDYHFGESLSRFRLTTDSCCDLEAVFNSPSREPANTEACQAGPDGQYHEDAVEPAVGSSDVAWAEGGGCILRPIREVWAVLNNLDLMRFRDTDRFTFVREKREDLAPLYSVTYYKGTIVGPIQFTLQWDHHVAEGSWAAPVKIDIAYQRTAGTFLIPTWHGKITLTKISDGVTGIWIRNEFHSRALPGSTNRSKADDALTEIIEKARTGSTTGSLLDDNSKEAPNATAPSP